MNRVSEVITKTIEAINFGFYHGDEVRSISVKRITSPIILDALNMPSPGGLYDPALGPLEQTESCITCGESALQCPGHFGHIDLILPVYNPILFKNLLKVLKKTCLFCHHFKMSEAKVQRFADQLEQIYEGNANIASSLIITSNPEMGRSPLGQKTVSCSERSGISTFDSEIVDSQEKCNGNRQSSSQIIAARDLISAFFSDMPKEKCENCSADVPTIRSEGVGKIFQVALQNSKLQANLMKGLHFDIPVLQGAIEANGSFKSAQQNRKNVDEHDLTEISEDIDMDLPEAVDETDTILEKDKGSCTGNTSKNALDSTHLDPCAQERFLTTAEVKAHITLLWEKEERMCRLIWGIQESFCKRILDERRNPFMFFLDALLVTPNRFRPPNYVNGSIMEHPMNFLYGQVIQANATLIGILREHKHEEGVVNFSIMDKAKVARSWLQLQNSVSKLLDSSSVIGKKGEAAGVRQLLEKKDGLFRMNLMGKRVNYSCRSVISPDPYISVNEIGIPPYFATRLTYPERVTYWNVDTLRDAVVRGANEHPGATHVEDEHGKVVSLSNLSKIQRIALSKTLLSRPGTTTNNTSGGAYGAYSENGRVSGKTVYRHLRDGDVVLVNRQPTLHKPSIMGHIVRVLKGEKTLRLHYANCSTYNADFDGDEMNVHFPQDEIARAEAYQVVNANEQFVVPTSGDPIRGLIQDHIVGAALLTKRDTFLTKAEYQQLVYSACISSSPATYMKGKCQPKVGLVDHDRWILSLPPAILKPEPLWTGKQVITTVLNYVTHGRPPYSVKLPGKVSGDYWGKCSGELKLNIQENELLQGVIDKAQFGKYGLVHAFSQFYGTEAAGHLLSIFSRLFTSFLQMHGFTCGISDLLLLPKAEEERQSKLGAVQHSGEKVHTAFVGIDPDTSGSLLLNMEIERVLQTKGESESIRLDRMMTSSLNVVTSDVNNTLFPKGLMKPFPANCLSLMTTTGAKGGLVNFTQISSLLGQQELEGRRVPRMISGKTLPSFSPWDTSARAGGFIGDRFLTGLRPQEYYFHCMAGRDGLVDTAVKTSRSGYLQRCLVKNLECLRVSYDQTVRDSDGSVIQFVYGEDGVDVSKTSYLTKFKALAKNRNLLEGKLGIEALSTADKNEILNGSGDESENNLELVTKIGSELFIEKLNDFVDKLSKKKKRRLHLLKRKDRSIFKELMKQNYIVSLAQPGEAVGVIAAQSIGEPSTQMTLNTFHFAGRGEMNVTLGIPRLREIFMTASKHILTPVMTCPLKPGKTREDCERLAAQLRRIRLAELVEKLVIKVVPFSSRGGSAQKVYHLKLKLHALSKYPHLSLQPSDCEQAVRDQFLPLLMKEVSRAVSFRSGRNIKDAIKVSPLSNLEGGGGDDASEDDEQSETSKVKNSKKAEYGEQAEEDEYEEASDVEGADAEKRKVRETDERGYDDEIEEGEDIDDPDEDLVVNESTDSDDDAEAKTADQIKAKLVASKPRKKGQGSEEGDGISFEGSTFKLQFSMSCNSPHVLLPEIVERVVKKVMVQSVDRIDRCSVIEYKEDGGETSIPALQTDGVNFEGLWALAEELDLNKLTTNDITSVLEVYGVEAARATIVSEVQKVFGSYGISVDNRHLNLIADFMTHDGGFRPCNRTGIDVNASPFLKMSFETASKFLVETSLRKQTDHLESPSSRIILGQVVELGTGCFELLQNISS